MVTKLAIEQLELELEPERQLAIKGSSTTIIHIGAV